MSLSRMYTPVLHFDDINGRPLVGGKLYTYEASSSIPAPTYRDKSGTLLNENPIALDERGECEVWLVDGLRYKMVLVDPIGTQVWEADDVSSSGSGSSSLRRINILSSDHSVDVEETYDEQTDSFNVDLGVKYENLPDKPTIPPAQVQSDWSQTNTQAPDYIKNKPTIPAAQVQSDWNQSNSQAVDYIKNKPQYTTTKFDGTNLVYNGSLATYTPPANSVCICDDFDGGWAISLLNIDVSNQVNNNVTIILKDMDVASGSGISVWGSTHQFVSGYTLIVFIRGNQVQFLDIPPKDKLEYVAQLPAQPDPDTYYFIPE